MYGGIFAAGSGCRSYSGYSAEKKGRVKERAVSSPFFCKL